MSASSNTVNTTGVLITSQSRGSTNNVALGEDVQTAADGDMFSASGSEETVTKCATRGAIRGGRVTDDSFSTSDCASTGTFYDGTR